MSVTIIKGTNPLSPAASQDGVTGLVIQGVAISAGAGALGIALGVSKELKSVKDAELLGINADYDKTNGMLVYYHIKEYFRLYPSGTLWIMLADQTVAWKTLASNADYAQKLINDSGGAIRILGLVFNPKSVYVPVIVNGMDSQVEEVITEAQALVVANELANTPIATVVVEGRGLTATVSTTLTDLRMLTAGNVTVLLGSDGSTKFRAILGTYTNSAQVNKHAAVGTYMGLIARSQVNHSPAWVERNDVQDTTNGLFLQTGLSNTNAMPTDMSGFKHKGYVFFYKDPDLPGTYPSGSDTCIATNDPRAYVELNRTATKAVKGIRKALLPSVEMPVLFDGNKIRRSVVEALATKGRKPLADMVKAEEISSFSLTIDPNQDVIGTGVLKVYYEIVPTGTAREIIGYVNFTNPNNP